ncbi:MAG: cysteine hydrolase [Anaerostipes sp.]|nr:cysteine hydrolase [Anaerostipes sp.]
MPDCYLIVVDMQNDFVTGSLGTDEAKQIVQPMVKKIEGYGGNVFFTIDSHKEDYLSTQEGKKLPVKHCISGTWGWQPVDEIQAMQQKRNGAIYMKPTFGCTKLVNDMIAANEQQSIKEIELVGVCTDICVVSNAIMLKNALPEVSVFVDSTCCAGSTPQKHQEALNVMESCQIGIR